MQEVTLLPFQLYRANLELQLRICKLLQEGGRHWLELSEHLSRDGIVETDTELRALLESGDWQSLSALPADSLGRLFQQRLGDGQAALQTAIRAQNIFAEGLQSALSSWQRATTEVLPAAAEADVWTNGPWAPLLGAWAAPLTAGARAQKAHADVAATSAAQPAKRPARKTASPPMPKPAAKQTPARKTFRTSARTRPSGALRGD
ncbi:hypothetical protein LU699_06805 [Luteimonas fraxinea]|uniref:Phasin domain-containing protein n=1 Tax=Luteimonas fraxinea TaxID=2901869 RepID=A0ABS8U6H1_9GAMM|nr:hypothetical protein [Luteimonas fraxinea]MCD9095378.1 hypothetical protein [Luteimonas fraxinea]MCD9126382.1 hypothetical protein [Luteimonas fraxinea]UHH11408.1 hypothetical protein LU699_06805 [Luteimonas fraxinea]